MLTWQGRVPGFQRKLGLELSADCGWCRRVRLKPSQGLIHLDSEIAHRWCIAVNKLGAERVQRLRVFLTVPEYREEFFASMVKVGTRRHAASFSTRDPPEYPQCSARAHSTGGPDNRNAIPEPVAA